MKFITYARNLADYNSLVNLVNTNKISANDLEVIVGLSDLSRFSESNADELLAIISLNQTHKLKLVLEWDVLKQDKLFSKCVESFKSLPLHEFHAVRLQDPGAIHFVKENYSWLKIQLILENGNHNFTGLKRWKDYLATQLDRLVLSNELSREHLNNYASSLNVDIEVLVFGRILLFYSPRILLSVLNKESIQKELENKNLEAFGTSEESPHTGFPLIENQHGTFMFNVKDLYLMDHLTELKELNIKAVRLDLRFDQTFDHLNTFVDLYNGRVNHEDMQHVKKAHPRPVIKGFYNINKTDVLFTKLKNKRIQRQDEDYVGEIVDVERDEQLALAIKSSKLNLRAGNELTITTPEGKTKTLTLHTILDTEKKSVETAGMNEIVLLPYLSGIVAKSQVYLKR